MQAKNQSCVECKCMWGGSASTPVSSGTRLSQPESFKLGFYFKPVSRKPPSWSYFGWRTSVKNEQIQPVFEELSFCEND
ncbi:rCG44708 [Rattus norvegicus]|uniref:RCG44708 n=1 Tax=Rattus norvegicus TaxID=10116 RepID=A6I5J4_RAT|nr:rCG44708 [Rattus norvegicus]